MINRCSSKFSNTNLIVGAILLEVSMKGSYLSNQFMEKEGYGRKRKAEDEGKGNDENNHPNCKCRLLSVMRTVKKDGPNQGKAFFCCPNQSDSSCNFFQWAEEPALAKKRTLAASPKVSSDIPNCKCGYPCKRLITQKEGPNKGKPFFKCLKNECNFFAWDNSARSDALQTDLRKPEAKDKNNFEDDHDVSEDEEEDSEEEEDESEDDVDEKFGEEETEEEQIVCPPRWKNTVQRTAGRTEPRNVSQQRTDTRFKNWKPSANSIEKDIGPFIVWTSYGYDRDGWHSYAGPPVRKLNEKKNHGYFTCARVNERVKEVFYRENPYGLSTDEIKSYDVNENYDIDGFLTLEVCPPDSERWTVSANTRDWWEREGRK